MDTRRYWTALLVGLTACVPVDSQTSDLESTAERFFRSVYGCTGDSIEGLAHEDVRMSYPIFSERLGSAVLEGREAVRRFSSGFCQRWSNPEVTIHEVVSEPGHVVLVWSFMATSAVEGVETGIEQSWGGISVFDLDESGRVTAEYGEESTPGPVARMGRQAERATLR